MSLNDELNCKKEELDALIEHHIGSDNSDTDLMCNTSISDIVATANQGSLSVAEAMRQIGIDSSSIDMPHIDAACTQNNFHNLVEATSSNYQTPIKIARLSTAGSNINEILTSSEYAASNHHNKSSSINKNMSSMNSSLPTISIGNQSITLNTTDLNATQNNSIMLTPAKLQEIVQLLQGGKVQVKPDNKVFVSVKQPSGLSGNSVTTGHQVLHLPQQITTSQLQMTSSQGGNNFATQQFLNIPNSVSFSSGVAPTSNVIKVMSGQTGPSITIPTNQSSRSVPELKNVRSVAANSSNNGIANNNTVILIPNSQQQLKVLSPNTVNSNSNSITSNVNITGGQLPMLTDSSGKVILLQYNNDNSLDTNAVTIRKAFNDNSVHLQSPQLDNKFQLNSSGSSTPWQQYVKQFSKLGPCPICGDKISGYHYGIFCCESCKGFFKRTVQNSKQYVCHMSSKAGDCDVSMASRKKCPACRFVKCVDKGMRVDAIRLDRTRGGRSMYPGARNRLYRNDSSFIGDDSAGGYDEESDQGSKLSGNLSPSSLQMRYPHVQNAGSGNNASITQLPSLKKKVPKILNDIAMIEQQISNEEDTLDFHESDDETSVYRALLNLADQRLYRIVRWSRNLPEFSAVDTDDQILLLQNCWADLLCLDCCWKSLPTPKEIRLTAHKCINLEAARELGADEVVSSLMQLTQDLDRLKLDITEYACLKVILLMQPDLKNLKASDRIRIYQEQISQLLMEYTMANYPQMTNKFGELFLRIPELHRTSTMAKEMLADKDMTPYLSQNSLLMELLRSDNRHSSSSNNPTSTGAGGVPSSQTETLVGQNSVLHQMNDNSMHNIN